MSKLEFKPQDRQSIDFAEEERLKSVGDSGKIIHEQDIDNSGKYANSYNLRNGSWLKVEAGNSKELYSTTINKKYNNTKLFIHALCNVYESTNGMGACLIVYVDGREKDRHLVNNSEFVTLYSAKIINGLAKGQHTISFVLACDSGHVQIPSYNDNKFVVIEL